MSRIAIVLFNLGGPDTLTAVRPFLFNLFMDPAIIRIPRVFRYLLAKLIVAFREKKTRNIYARLGGKSPLLENTKAQSSALQDVLHTKGLVAKTFVCMRYWHPMSFEVVKHVHEFAPDQIVLLPLYPQFSTTTTESSFVDWKTAWQAAGYAAIPTETIGCYPTDTRLVNAFVKLSIPIIKEAVCYGRPHILFSAHGLPQSIIDAGDPYQYQVEQTAKHIETALKAHLGDVCDATTCYQSRVGPKKWIGPSTDSMIEQLATEKRPIVVVPVSFVSDHSETLIELDQDYKNLAIQKGAPFYGRVPSLACHPEFIESLASLVVTSLSQDYNPHGCKSPTFCACARNQNKGTP